jgi:alkylresorcinol/alkylpyrone synthase
VYISGLGTAVPARSYSQPECWEALQRAERPELSARTRATLQRILNHDHGISRRSLALETLDEGFELDADTLHRRFVKHAPALASSAAARALEQAGLEPKAVDAVVVSTCTGYLCPGLTSYVAESLGLRRDVFPLDLVGQGCAAALPNLRAAGSLVRSQEAGTVLSICVEVCSAAMYLDDDLGVLVSACLFGDGAAAAVLTAQPPGARRRVRWVECESATQPAHRDALRFETVGGRLRNILTLPVPRLAAQNARAVFDSASRRAGFERSAISGWVMHAGGRRVLDEVGSAMRLDARDLAHSASVLRDYGNLSSPFVLFVLDRALREAAPGGLWWMSAFGAGFSCHGALLEVAAA